MPGQTRKITTTADSKDKQLAQIIGGSVDPNPSFAISIRADPNNASGKAIYVGRGAAIEPFYADDSRTYYSCRSEELVINDGGNNALIYYVDESGPMDPLAQYVTAVPPRGWAGGKGPNDPTP